MNKEVGRNDPCPCGSGKKYKKCCELRLGKRKFTASVIPSGGKASQISTSFFNQPTPKAEEPHHPPEADKPM
jgi:hypothetical protein